MTTRQSKVASDVTDWCFLPKTIARYSTAYAAYGREVPADIQAPLSLLFRQRSILKLLRRLTMGYALPGAPLDINQKTRVLWQSALHTGKYGTSLVWFLIYESKFTTI